MLFELKKLVDALVRDESERISRSDRASAIALAIVRYSSDRPRSKVEDVISLGGDTLPLPTAWETGSTVSTAEYPIGESPVSYLPCSIYTRPDGDVIRLGESLQAGAEVRLAFSILHVVTDEIDTIAPGHREAVACWAAALLLEELAAASINDGDSTIQADSTDRRTKAQEYAARARTLKARYSEALGLNKEGVQAAAGSSVAWPSRTRLTNGVRRHG